MVVKLVGLIRSLHGGTKARIGFSGSLFEEIPVYNGVKYGDISAPTLFTIYFEVAFLVTFNENLDGIFIRYRTSGKVYNICKLLAQTKVSSSLVRELLYADDCDIITHSEDEMQRFMNRFAHAYKAFGLEINLKKIVVTHNPAPGLPCIDPAIYIEMEKLVVVQTFVYLASRLAEGCSLDKRDVFAH